MWQKVALMVAVFLTSCASNNPDLCPIPPSVTSAQTKNEFGIVQNFFVGRRIYYECLPGYIQNENTTDFVICQSNLTWSEPLISCIPIDCGDPKDIKNGYHKATGRTYGSIATYDCNKGYQLIGKGTIVCTIDGWNKNIPFCDTILCDPPNPISNGDMTERDSWDIGTDAKYSCHAGYALIGQHTINCTDTGDWSHDPPICKTTECNKPDKIEFGFVDELAVSSSLKRLKYSCYPGYHLVGKQYRSCFISGWEGKAPKCEPRSCGNPGEILNGYYEASNDKLGSVVTFFCNNGYRIIGRNNRMCEAQGWSGQIPTCEVVTCNQLEDISHGRTPIPPNEGVWENGMVAKFSCFSDHSLIGAEELVCTETGKWDKNPPTCKVVQCHRPDLPESGHVVAGFGPTYKYRETITYRCNHGFKIVGSNVIECTENNEFLPPPPICELSGCLQPKRIDNGRRIDERSIYALYEEVTYQCIKGYILIGSSVIQCQENNTFVPPPPICKPITCDAPSAIQNGEIRRYRYSNKYRYGEIITFSCKIGFKPPSQESKCKEGGLFQPVPYCQIVTCPAPRRVKNGKITPHKHEYTYGDRISFRCDSGFEPLDEVISMCNEHGFHPPIPTCKQAPKRNQKELLKDIISLGGQIIEKKEISIKIEEDLLKHEKESLQKFEKILQIAKEILKGVKIL
ncbi:zona pellucida sperm-binding protein 3 receptor-like isoform X2 [Cetorhinus maximus]